MAGGIRQAVLVAAIAVLALPATASASCSYQSGSHTLSIVIDRKVRVVRSGTDVRVYDIEADKTETLQSCSGDTPTVSNVDTVSVDPSSDGSTALVIDQTGGRFTPGFSDETGFSDEIEFTGVADVYTEVVGTTGADEMVLGASGVNVNAASEGGFPSPNDVDVSGFLFYQLDGREGDDALSSAGGDGTGGSAQAFPMLGGAGNDTLKGGSEDDAVNGGPGDDVLSDAGGFSDSVNYDGAPGGVTVSFATTSPQNTGAGGTDTIGEGFEVLHGSEGNDVLTGGPYGDTLSGIDGDDTFDGGPGADFITGGPGTDTVSYASVTAGGVDATVPPPGITDTTKVTGGGGNDELNEIENLIGSAVGDKLTGNEFPNVLTGGGGNDELSGLNGADTFFVKDGNEDTVACGLDNDTVDADPEGTDTIATDCETVAFLDVTPPETTITSGPEGSIAANSASFTFGSSEPGSAFLCSLDGAPPVECESPAAFAPLAEGAHSFAVQARDAAGNVDSTPATRSFTVDTIAELLPPVLSKLRVQGKRVKFRLSQEAKVTLRLERKVKGRWKKLKGKQKAEAKKGRNSVRLKRAWRPNQLSRGKYRLSAVAKNQAGKSKRRRATFQVRRA